MKVIARVTSNTSNFDSEDLNITYVAGQETRFTFKTPQPNTNYYFMGMTVNNLGDDSYSTFGVGIQLMNKSTTSFQIFSAGRSDYDQRMNFIVFRIDEDVEGDDMLPSEILFYDKREIVHHTDGFTGEFSLENSDEDLVIKTTKDYQNRIFMTQTVSNIRETIAVRQVYFEEGQVRLKLGYSGKQDWVQTGIDIAGVFIFVYDTDKYFKRPVKEIKSIYDSKKDISIQETYVTSVDNYATGKYKVTLNKDIDDDLLIFCDLDAETTYTERSSTIDFSRTGVTIGANEFDIYIYTSRGIYAYQNSYFSLKFIDTKEVL